MRCILSALLFSCLPLRAASIWQEGETPAANTMHRHPWWFDQVKKDLLSGGDWISNFSKEEGTADYKVEVKEAGDYVLWLRANPTATKLSWSLDAGDWNAVDFANEKRGQQNIAADGKPDLRFIAWVKAGIVKLTAGAHTLKFKMHGTKDNHGGLDCFVLTNDGFVPNGLLKPGATAAGGPDEWFPLLADEDRFSSESVIDMSALIEVPAGKHGPVIAKGSELVFAQHPDKAVKFWGCGANLEQDQYDRQKQKLRIRYLKKFGNNVVRQHPLFDEVSKDGKIDAKRLDAYDWWFAELKKAGIYSTWSVFYHFPISEADGYDPALFAEMEPMGKAELRDTYGLISMSPELWAIRTKVLLSLLNHKNPYTELRYADDPALLCVEYQNEDSIFFWNPLGDLSSPTPKKWKAHGKKLRGMFAAWAKKKYGTTEALKKAWGKLDGTDKLDSELGLMGPWEMDGAGIRGRYAGNTARAADIMKFLTQMQTELYTACEKAIRGTGFKAQTVTTNWLGGSGLLDQANILTDTVGSMIDRHNYAGGGKGVHNIAEGQVYAGSHLEKPGSHLFSIALKQVEDRPFSMSEWTMCPPTRWKLECAPIMAFYGMGLQGWDCSYHFIQSGTRLGDGWPNMSSYATDTPHYIGQWPALAFALHKGHIAQGAPVAARRTTPDKVVSGTPAWLQDYYNGDDLIPAPGGTPQEVFAAGRVTVSFKGGESVKADLSKLWQKDAKTVQSNTGELTWDYGHERILVGSAKTQGVIGKCGGAVKLPAVDLEVKTEFVSLLFTPLDDQPLANSKHILITALGQDKQTGAKYSDDGTKLLSTGTAPLLLEPVQATIRIAGAAPAMVRPLDHYGVPMKSTLEVKDGKFTIDGRSRAYYYEVSR
ncbi:MAG TPA: hypothetical protein VG796_16205 [Verrucomicrobiales bacterium]|nr:hypothetical protein [Verrucomicrobiales bacterium]